MKALDKKQILIDTAVILIVILVFAFFAYYPQRNVTKNHRYTIATVTDIEGTLNGDPDAIFTFTVGGRKYSGSGSSYKGGGVFLNKGDRLFVEFYPSDPNECNMLKEKYVSNKLIEIPTMGWDTIPY